MIEVKFMVNKNPHTIYLKVHFHFDGVFTRHPLRYTGGDTFMFTDHLFVGMDHEGVAPFYNGLLENL